MTELVGILNVTPDSFSDGGAFFSPKAAIDAMAEMAEQGAEIIDIGAESTRPGAAPVLPEEEWKRLEPVLAALPHFPKVTFSVDTRHAETARRALGAGAHWINDVSGFADAAMVAAVKDFDCKIVVMHSLSVPADKTVVMPEPSDVVAELMQWASERLAQLEQAGIVRSRIIFDPGIGFGKTAAQSLAIVRDIAKFKALGVPLMVGHSRKSFLNSLPHRGRVRVGELSIEQERPPPNLPPTGGGNDVTTLLVSQYLAMQGVDFLRVHDVAAHKKLLKELHA